ncbi:Uncharacterised protein [Salmonella enterica subsp. enterica serovar Typhi]|nr:Uncharacterised protein [Salmonella enterica subsp. enterica serovar Typhi]CFW76927.1 Uncharacterised protein [Salmonella enterica subsp. enterica serovar Bovismorbificans]CGX45141.1 Uncharacterised protein [Salmonella enterica subsp. enterica serovar Typhi]CHH63712.1 Uncharacterised protein [Salmonella enterica subsp. enterica serovar Typhi]CNV05823.1 Uncharacterised protein [Salmonella enterica subsp. enterica serovar Bovismorbificans]
MTDNFPFSGDSQSIFIIQAGPVDIHRHITCRQLTLFEMLHGCEGFTVLLF